MAVGFSHLIAPELLRRGQISRSSFSDPGRDKNHQFFKILLPFMIFKQPAEDGNLLKIRNAALRFLPGIFQYSAENDSLAVLDEDIGHRFTVQFIGNN